MTPRVRIPKAHSDGSAPGMISAPAAVYPGSFDPVTNGHMDIIRRAARLYPRLIVAAVVNPNKRPWLTLDERVHLLRLACAGIPGIEVDSFDGLLVDYVHRRGAALIIKGLRIVSDFEYEFSMALLNRRLRGGVDTMFLPASLEYAYISSSFVREVFALGGDISEFVPAPVLQALKKIPASSRAWPARRPVEGKTR